MNFPKKWIFYQFLDNLVFLNLLILTITYWINLVNPGKSFLSSLNWYGTFSSNFLIFALLGLRWLNFGYFPLSNLYESLFFLAWGITLFTLVIHRNAKSHFIGALNIPLALFLVGFASLSLPESMQAPSPLVPALKSNWLMMHVSVMMISYASLIVGSLLSIFFLILIKIRKEKTGVQGNSYDESFPSTQPTITAFYKSDVDSSNFQSKNYLSRLQETNRLSFLDSVDNLSYRAISFGFPLLTIGIIAGAVWANEAWGSYWSWDPKETWALITWLTFAVYLHTRLTKDWQGEKPAIIAAFGFIVVWICYLGVNFLGKGLHTYGQIL